MKPLLVSKYEKESILSDFKNKINDWCEFMALEHKIPKTEMCKYAVQIFGEDMSETQIRHWIHEKYKNPSQCINAKQKVTAQEKKVNKLRSIAKRMGLNVVGVIEDAVTPMNEVGSLISKDVSQ